MAQTHPRRHTGLATPFTLRQETFLRRSIRLFPVNIRQHYRILTRWRTRAIAPAVTLGESLFKYLPVLGLALAIVTGLIALWMAWHPTSGDKPPILAAPMMVAVVAVMVLPFAWGCILVLTIGVRLLILSTRVLFLLLWAVGVIGCVLCETVKVVGQYLLLFPFLGLFLVTRLIQLWRHVFYTCPARGCAYRGLPAYVCPDCGEPNEKLWPNLCGLLWHSCVRCRRLLPVLTIIGRDKLKRQCGDPHCRWPLDGRRAGKAPERLVAVVGGPTSGKSCYVLMAIDQIVNDQVNGCNRLHGQIDVPDQKQGFEREGRELARGRVPAKTAKVYRAFLMYVKARGKWCQLYLYDAPGEESASLKAMSSQKYFPLLEGFILLVDPECFAEVSGPEVSRSRMSLQEVVNSTLGKALKEMQPESGGKIGKRVAVVIGKADIAAVRERIGDVRKGPISDEMCRQAIADWGGRNTIQAIENHFTEVKYFACSQLGRTSDGTNHEPFSGAGLVEPLEWILDRR